MAVPARLRWRCRRGTKELDIVLLRFLEQAFERLSIPEQETVESLLDAQDPDLAGWIWGGETPPAEWASLIRQIQAVSDIDARDPDGESA